VLKIAFATIICYTGYNTFRTALYLLVFTVMDSFSFYFFGWNRSRWRRKLWFIYLV